VLLNRLKRENGMEGLMWWFEGAWRNLVVILGVVIDVRRLVRMSSGLKSLMGRFGRIFMGET